MRDIAIIGIVLILMQYIFSIYQIRHYKGFIKKIAKKYDNTKGYRLQTEVEKTRGQSAVVLVVLDDQNRIVEGYHYSGFIVFAKFKKLDSITGKTIGQELIDELNKTKLSKLKKKAFEKLFNKVMRATAS